VVVDDGSRRPVEPLLARWQGRLTVVRTANRGVAAARNTGIQRSTGDFIALLDQDDVWRPDKLARQLSVLLAQPDVALVHSDVLFRDERTGRTYHADRPRASLSGDCYRRLFSGSSISACTIVVRRSALDAVGLFDEAIRGTDDYDLALRIARHFPFAYIHEPLATYRFHDANWSHRSLDMLRGELRVVEKAIAEDDRLHERVGVRAIRARRGDLLRSIGYRLLEEAATTEAREALARSLRLDFRSQAAIWYASTFVPRPVVDALRRLKAAPRG
jgi:glycosyltransferase involved in cell wall biosynthesis